MNQNADDVAGQQPAQVAARDEQGDEAAEDVQRRLVEEERMEAGRALPGTRRSSTVSTRWAQPIAMPHGRLVGGPYSSWLKKLPQRAMPCANSAPGTSESAESRNGDVLQRV